MKNIIVIDYGCSNILSLVRAIKFLGYTAEITKERKKILSASHVILPGVGAFGSAMQQLKKLNLEEAIIEYANSSKPLFGICLGMQILFTKSCEFGSHKGLDLIKGKVVKISNNANKHIKIPHIGWNEIYPNNNEKEWKHKILKNLSIEKNFYFVHSYICLTKQPDITIAVCDYLNHSIPAFVASKNIFGCQFHPEKSGENGINILKNFCEI
jgi:glutamine amidotransferase